MEPISALTGLIAGIVICQSFHTATAKLTKAQAQFDRAAAARKKVVDDKHTASASRWGGVQSVVEGVAGYGLTLVLVGLTVWGLVGL